MQRKLAIVFGLLVSPLIVSGCAALIPSASSGESFLVASSALPTRVMILPGDWIFDDSVGKVLRSELPSLGFTLVEADPDAVFVGAIETSDFAPVHLDLRLERASTREVLWRASTRRAYDLYASIMSASEDNAREAMRLLADDLRATHAIR